MKSLDEKTYEQIERYLQDKLPPEEATQLKNRVEQDADFRKEVNWMKTMLSLHKYKREFEVLDEFKKIHKENQIAPDEKEEAPPKGPKVVNLRRWLVAASIMALIGFFIYDWPPKETDIPTPSPIPVNQPTIPIAGYDLIDLKKDMNTLGKEEEEARREALKLIDENKHIAALPFLEKYFAGLPDEEEDHKMRLEAGKIYLKKLYDWDKAATHFQAAKNNGLGPHKIEADFYMVFVLHEKGDEKGALKLLNEIAANEEYPFWKKKAERLLEVIVEN